MERHAKATALTRENALTLTRRVEAGHVLHGLDERQVLALLLTAHQHEGERQRGRDASAIAAVNQGATLSGTERTHGEYKRNAKSQLERTKMG